ncbi:hypothetical protein ACHAWF_004630 [Thalassiosira exigua]
MDGDLKMWYIKNGIANICSIPKLERTGYKVDYHTDKEWVIISSKWEQIQAKWDTGVCDRMPYTDLREYPSGIFLLHAVHKNFEGFTKRKAQEATRARDAITMMGDSLSEEVQHGGKLDTRQKPERGETGYVSIPRDFHALHRFITLASDVMSVNNVAFLSQSRKGSCSTPPNTARIDEGTT